MFERAASPPSWGSDEAALGTWEARSGDEYWNRKVGLLTALAWKEILEGRERVDGEWVLRRREEGFGIRGYR